MINQAKNLWEHIIERGLHYESNFKESLDLNSGASEVDLQLVEDILGLRK